jgi:hypothetical protein
MLSEISQKENSPWFHLYVEWKIELIELESKMVGY